VYVYSVTCTVYAKMQGDPDLQCPKNIVCLPRENAFIQIQYNPPDMMYAKKQICHYLIHLKHKTRNILFTLTSQSHCHLSLCLDSQF
jgi:hypothetical protein